MKPIYIRTDKNGTKIFHDYTCPRCGGAGESEKWLYTGKVCFECGGSGKRTRPLVVKEYTDEYAAKLEARRRAKIAKYEEEHAEEIARENAERERKVAEWKKERYLFIFSENGCGSNGIGYVLKGKTFPIKDQIKAKGGKWCYGVWICPEEIKAKGVSAIRIDLSRSLEDGAKAPCEVIWDAIGDY